MVITDDFVELRRRRPELQGEICWDYSGPQKAPLDVLTQYGFFSTGENVRHVVPLRSEALGHLLDGAINVPVIEGARDTILRRRRAVAVRFCVDLEQSPILRHRREAPSSVIFWVDVADPLASPLALALRVCLADEGEVVLRGTGRSEHGSFRSARRANVRGGCAEATVRWLSSRSFPPRSLMPVPSLNIKESSCTQAGLRGWPEAVMYAPVIVRCATWVRDGSRAHFV